MTGATAVEISASIESGIRRADLAPGDPLPPVRALATALAVSPATVSRAYAELRQRGLVVTAGRHGTRVRPRPPVAARRAALRPPPAPGLRDLSRGEPDPRLLPPLRPHLATLADSAGEPVGYPDVGVLPEMAAAARARLAADGVPAAEVTLTGGALDGIERLLGAHLRPGDPVAVEDPGWASLLDLLAALGLRPIGVPVDDDGPIVTGVAAALAAGARALIVTSRAQNPTGAALSADRAGALRALLAGHADVLLIEDDHAAELARVPLHPLAGATTNWAFLRSVSKPFGPDLRLAVLAGDETTVARVAGRARVGAGWVSTVLQRLVLSLWRDPAVAALVDRAAGSYERRRDGLMAALADRGLPAHGRSGINVWLPVTDETVASTVLRDAGWLAAPGALYRIAGPPALRITVSSLDEAELPALADVLARAARPAPPGGFTA
ncbi:DNA-binding transcriptional regulator, MocR family, contains an aminotransferase domain [Micromonospora phaseoli]|uniref:DNA-binding transcriptional regulator, MocR family, contains an aminotransferase domain n=1 Tax=Micromonospora phaseoli TaxID=1144548 RepID=A0A1H6RM95_9ACTN|nr:DNA-binding transcriptional MocR family regulator [Micromonospora phaseoli]GIJ77135.1 GntR family transcriptional regulator [Micromonospora phaseoli]SEI56881.1 DNA-binding transcriptional regulator, MocR family, contains an aminotransferase domain [Micromonospora phaseoli]